MSHETEYRGFCQKVVHLKSHGENATQLMKVLTSLNEAIMEVAEHGTDGLKLHKLAQSAEQVRLAAVRTPGLKPLRTPDCLSALAKAMYQASYAADISAQLLPTAQAFPASLA